MNGHGCACLLCICSKVPLDVIVFGVVAIVIVAEQLSIVLMLQSLHVPE